MTKNPRQEGFYIAPFAPDGEGLGVGFSHFSNMSAKWIENCRSFLRTHGAVFKESWGQQLQKIATRLTSANGAGIGTFYVGVIPAVSTLYLPGIDKAADQEVTGMFVASMLKVDIVRKAATSAKPFADIYSIAGRPLCVAVVWQNPNISDEDFDL